MVIASAPGKLILFGEHFVVYGLPAIATAIESRTLAEAQHAQKFSLIDNRPETPGYKKEKQYQQADSIKRIFKAMGVDGTKVKIILSGDLIAASGVGASAASCSAIAAALNEEFKLGFDLENINEAAYEGEKGYHGIPSGIDNSCSTFGGFIWFKKGTTSEKSIIKSLNSRVSLSLVVGNTGITSDTKKVVEAVRKDKEKDPDKFIRIFSTYMKIVEEAEPAIEKRDLITIGLLMNKNQGLLREIGVSCPEIERLVDLAIKNGALGAKLTGTGRGGLIIALVTDGTKNKVASAIENAGFKSQITKIGAEGVKVIR